MENSPHSAAEHSASWYFVCIGSGAMAVVSAEDLVELIEVGSVLSAFMISGEMGRSFEASRARAGYMSATCRLKSGGKR